MRQHALIIGGGIGGLLAALALEGQFQRISVLERGEYPDLQTEGSPAMRPSAPQSRCLHVMMAAGASAMDELLPGWRAQLQSLGAVPFDASRDAVMRLSAGCLPRSCSGITLYACSRSLLEHMLRLRIGSAPGISLYTRQEVRGLAHDRSRQAVKGVWLQQPATAQCDLIEADLVVDASGAASRLPQWLAQGANVAAGTDSPDSSAHGSVVPVRETVVSPGRRQVSCWFHIDPEEAPDWHCLALAPDPCNAWRSLMMLRAEHDRWGLVLVDPTRESLPRTPAALRELVARFNECQLSGMLQRATPVSPVHRLSPSINRWRHHEESAFWPNGLVALGDSACTLDPYAGLGMSLAARASLLLRDEISKNRESAPECRRFQQALAEQNRPAWEQTTGCDVEGHALREDSLHLRQLYEAAPGSQAITHALLAVQNLLSPRQSLSSREFA
ncbi:NAD(P)/FAD-dependent oxidoreductase [Granulosicoccus sp. 3-233]|uniref:NAD(P)/FAD-dependent oxidoreductase n=1 Tax=Granulosicoccus sp. 3-233 TaxID=3417969 RepID=UPI003D34C733